MECGDEYLGHPKSVFVAVCYPGSIREILILLEMFYLKEVV